ncbi:hypothetical protein Q8A73_007703 [Channa argus]|nr:hypothetical protein Q8A73_007703 [Channa argus]
MVPSPSSMTTLHIHDSGNVTGITATNHTLSNMAKIYCPSFTCNYSDCYTMYMHYNQNNTSCGPDAYCQLMKEMDMYDVGCSTNCTKSCGNASQTNCSVKCCNFTGCLNDSFASMMTATTVKKGDCRFQGTVDGGLHSQLLCPNPVQGLYTASVSSRVLQRHYDVLPMVEWNAEFPFFCHKRPLS